MAGDYRGLFECPSESYMVCYGGVREQVTWLGRPREPGKHWLVLSGIDSQDTPFSSLPFNHSLFNRDCRGQHE